MPLNHNSQGRVADSISYDEYVRGAEGQPKGNVVGKIGMRHNIRFRARRMLKAHPKLGAALHYVTPNLVVAAFLAGAYFGLLPLFDAMMRNGMAKLLNHVSKAPISDQTIPSAIGDITAPATTSIARQIDLGVTIGHILVICLLCTSFVFLLSVAVRNTMIHRLTNKHTGDWNTDAASTTATSFLNFEFIGKRTASAIGVLTFAVYVIGILSGYLAS